MARIKKLEDNLKRLAPLQDSLDGQQSKDWDKFKAKMEAVMMRATAATRALMPQQIPS